MPREFKLPDVGEGVAEGEIVQWLVSAGDRVSEDQPVVEVETDKALVEIPSPVDGVVSELHAEEGDVVPVGSVLVTFEVEGEAGEAGAAAGETVQAESAEIPGVEEEAGETPATEGGEAAPGGRTFAPPNVRRLAREMGVDIDGVSGSGPGGRVTEGDVRAAAEGGAAEAGEAAEAAPSEAESSPAGGEAADEATAAPTAGAASAAERDKTLAAPATRRVAKELGVDIDAVPATEERDGEAFVTEEAVRTFAEAGEAGAAAAGEAAAEAAAAPPAPAAGERETREPYRGLRRTIGEQMVTSKSTIPHVHSFEMVEVPRLVETRERLKPAAEEQGIDLTFMPLIMKALVAALGDFPSLNATLDEEAEEIVYKRYYNVGVATHTEAGLMVPVVKDVDEKGLLQIASEISELSQKARDRSIALEEMQDGTFTITNYGAVGGEFGTPIINHPEVAIMGVGRIEERPVVEDGEVVARPTLPLSLGIDHRVIDGGTEAQFRNRLVAYLQEPARLLLE
ncbi:MAG TPA: dihydrolipoamide acetyltransferase family protein [Halobacteriales archaeon]|nr:dihydrolipoamide acetyltransferase family protein [Halobacteriales archaeon]